MAFHVKWQKQLCEVLERDPQGHLGQTYYELAHVIDKECTEFPNPAVLTAYVLPLTSWSDGGQPPVSMVMSRQPNLVALAAFSSGYLGWSAEIIQMKLMQPRVGMAICALLQVRVLHSHVTFMLVLPSILVTR